MMRGRFSLSAMVAMSLKAFTSPLSVALIWGQRAREGGREVYTHTVSIHTDNGKEETPSLRFCIISTVSQRDMIGRG